MNAYFGLHGDGVVVGPGATAEVTDSTISGALDWGVLAVGGGTVSLKGSHVIGESGPARGRGIIAYGAAATLNDVAVVATLARGLLAQEKGGSIDATQVLVRDVRQDPNDADAAGVEAGYGGSVSLSDAAVVEADVVGVEVAESSLDVASAASLDHVIVLRSRPDANGKYGRGLEVADGTNAAIRQSAFYDHTEVAVSVGRGATLDMSASVVAHTTQNAAGKFGHGVIALDGAILVLDTCLVRDHAGTGLAFSHAGGTVLDVLVQNNTIGLYATGVDLHEVDTPPGEPTAATVYVSGSRFIANATRVSSDFLPLPDVRLPAEVHEPGT